VIILIDFFWLFFSSIIFFSIIQIVKANNSYFSQQNHKFGIEKNYKPRFGGLGLMILISFLMFSESSSFIKLFVLSIFPIFILNIIDDTFQNISEKKRIIITFFSSLIFIHLIGYDLPALENVPLINVIITNDICRLFFFIFVLTGFINAVNMTDGANGICSFYTLISLIIFKKFLNLYNLDESLVNDINIVVYFYFVFFLFNYPFGKLYLGDSGSYISGFLLGSLSLYIYNIQPIEITPWIYVLILIYPIMEILFTLFRRILNLKNPTKPDNMHLHNLIHDFINKNKITKNFASEIKNSFVLIILLPLMLLPFLSIQIFGFENFIFYTIILFIFSYLCLYFYLSKGFK